MTPSSSSNYWNSRRTVVVLFEVFWYTACFCCWLTLSCVYIGGLRARSSFIFFGKSVIYIPTRFDSVYSLVCVRFCNSKLWACTILFQSCSWLVVALWFNNWTSEMLTVWFEIKSSDFISFVWAPSYGVWKRSATFRAVSLTGWRGNFYCFFIGNLSPKLLS